MGTPESAVPSLDRILKDNHEVVAVWTQPDRPSGRGHKLTMPPVKEFALQRGLAVYQPSKIKTRESKALFASHLADLAVVVAYGRILPTEFLQTPKRGCLNVHFSLLPLYRGAAPVNWALIEGADRTGVTTMFIEEELDSGPILMQRDTAIGDRETAPELMARLATMGADLLGETLAKLHSITPRPQRDRDATFAPILKKEMGLIDWTAPASHIERRVRGLQSWPNAYTHFRQHRLTIMRSAEAERTTNASPGQVVQAQGDDLVVACGEETALRLLEVQPEAKRRMSVRDFLNGSRLAIGDKFE